MKLKLKRRMSGKKIKEAKRKVEFSNHRFDYSYRKNTVVGQKRRDNPNIYEGDIPVGARFTAIRLPKKGRKTAWKRFRKNFPYIKVTKSGGKRFDEQKFKEFRDSIRSKEESRRNQS